MAACKPGEPIELRPEPKNPADEHAVAVYSARGIQLGYLTAERAPRIGAMIRQGREIAGLLRQASVVYRRPDESWELLPRRVMWPSSRRYIT